MFSSEQYRAKAREYGNLAETAVDADEKREYQKLQLRYTGLADNEEWLAGHRQQTLHVADMEHSAGAFPAEDAPAFLAEDEPSFPAKDEPSAQEEEHMLRCLGAALIMQWGTLPRKLQRELFDSAGAMGDLLDMASLRGQIARFLHKSKSDLH